jgi:hypothetical protein
MHAWIARLAVVACICGFSLSTKAAAEATCFCVLSTDNIEGRGTTLGFNVDLTSRVNQSYSGIGQQSEANQAQCASLCRAQTLNYVNEPGSGAPFCAAHFPNGTQMGSYSKVGTRNYRAASDTTKTPTRLNVILFSHPFFNLTTYTCPPTWYGAGNILGGVTPDGRCKKLAGYLSISPPPANGTQLGNWGFSWGNEMWAYSSPSNGGAPTAQTTTMGTGECYLAL